MATFTQYFGDIEYDVEIEGGECFIEHINTDLGVEPEDLFLLDPVRPFKLNGDPNYISFSQYLCDHAHQVFIEEWGSEEAFYEEQYGDMKYDEQQN